MANDPRLEAYLSKIERVLMPFSASDRAEIITELKSHVLSALERDPQAQMDSVLAALGEPETVANRYLMERGMKPAKPPISPVVKWLVIGFLGTMAMSLIFIGVVFTRFSPVLKIDGKHDRVSILGGTIEIDGENGTVRIGGNLIQGGDDESTPFEGSWSPPNKDQEFLFQFGNGKIDLKNSASSDVSWKCRGKLNGDAPRPTAGNPAGFDLTSLKGVKCTLEVPEKLRLTIKGNNGDIEADEPHYHLDASLENGKVSLGPDKSRAYKYSLTVARGKVDRFDSSETPDALHITVHLTNGLIDRS